MRSRQLLRLLQPIVLAGLPAAGAGCVESVIDTDCTDTVSDTYRIDTPADPPLQLRIERCRLDRDACSDLCQETLQRDSVGSPPTSCKVSFGDASVEIEVRYEVSTGGEGCPVEGAVDGGVFTARELGPAADLGPAAPGLPDRPQARGRSAGTLDSAWNATWNGGRSCHAS